MNLPQRRIQLEKDLDKAFQERDHTAIRMISMELRDLEDELNKRIDCTVARMYIARHDATRYAQN